jgi:N-acetylglucosaminyldiphosphoundecaprenol N-acetyl-beta-D-mannosaminyltransferase
MSAKLDRDYRKILGINFFVGRAPEAVRLGLNGGLVVAPAAPALVSLPRDEGYRRAVSSADLALTDSSFMVLVWNFQRRDKIIRISGLEYLVWLLDECKARQRERLFFIMPGQEALDRNTKWLCERGFALEERDSYVAPRYSADKVVDERLVSLLEARRPTQIIVGLGGGIQEKLGLYLRNHLTYTPGIHCIGAAIGFLTGDQVRIPLWADRLYLGWLFRCVHRPLHFIPRYWTARKLLWLLVMNQDRMP